MPKREYDFFVYIAASRSHQLYVGVTNSLVRRMKEHRERRQGAYAARYGIDRLVWYEHHQYILNAIARETELKDWNRARKIALIEGVNPTWHDLSAVFGTMHTGGDAGRVVDTNARATADSCGMTTRGATTTAAATARARATATATADSCGMTTRGATTAAAATATAAARATADSFGMTTREATAAAAATATTAATADSCGMTTREAMATADSSAALTFTERPNSPIPRNSGRAAE